MEPVFRNSRVFLGLSTLLWQYSCAKCYDLAVISGTPRQARLYRRAGFEPFGPPVGTAEAPYQPMLLRLEIIAPRLNELLHFHPAALVNRNG